MVITTEGTSHLLVGHLGEVLILLSVTARTDTYHLIALKGCQVIECH